MKILKVITLSFLFLCCSCEQVQTLSAYIDFKLGNYSSSAKKLENVIKTYPQNHKAKFYLAKCYYKLGNWEKAFYIWHNLPKEFSKNLFKSQIEDIKIELKELDNIIELYKLKDKSVKDRLKDFIDRTDTPFLLARAYYLLGDISLKEGNLNLSEEYFNKALKYNYSPISQLILEKRAKLNNKIYYELINNYPNSPFINGWFYTLITQYIKNKDWNALSKLKDKIKNKSVYERALFYICNYFEEDKNKILPFVKEYINNYSNSKHISTILTKIYKDRELFNNKEKYSIAMLLYKNKFYIPCIEFIKSTSIRSMEINYILGECYRNIGNLSQAKQILLNLLNYKESKYYPKAIFSLALIEKELGNYNQAIKYFSLIDSKTPHLEAKSLWEKASIYRILKDTNNEVKNYEKLYTLYPEDTQATSALWRHFFIVYKNNDYSKAVKLAELFINKYKNSELYTRFLYFLANIKETNGDKETAKKFYAECTGRELYNFYTYQAHKRLEELNYLELSKLSSSQEKLKSINKLLSSLPNLSNQLEYYLNLYPIEHFFKLPIEIQELIFLKEYTKALNYLHENIGEKNYDFTIAWLYLLEGKYNSSIKLAEKYEGIEFLPLTFPVGYKDYVIKECKKYSIDPALAFAMIWQESKYAPYVVSSAGAIGLMQLMPYTAKGIANTLGYKDFNPIKLYEPKLNIEFGVYYLNNTLNIFKNIPQAVASYNAGPGAVSRWNKQFGYLEDFEFIEAIPYLETRNYVKNVLAIYEIYKILLKK